MYTFGAILAATIYLAIPEYHSKAFFEGYSPMVFVLIFVQATYGLAVGYAYKYADVLIKNLSTSATLALLVALSALFFDKPLTFNSIFGSVVPYHQHKGAYWKDYVNSSDIVGFDAYPFGPTIPVPGGDGVELGCRSFEQSLSGRCFRNLSVIAEAVDGVTSFAPAARKPIWLVDQVMGNRELFRREPSAQEERAVAYLALIHGASGTL